MDPGPALGLTRPEFGSPRRSAVEGSTNALRANSGSLSQCRTGGYMRAALGGHAVRPIDEVIAGVAAFHMPPRLSWVCSSMIETANPTRSTRSPLLAHSRTAGTGPSSRRSRPRLPRDQTLGGPTRHAHRATQCVDLAAGCGDFTTSVPPVLVLAVVGGVAGAG